MKRLGIFALACCITGTSPLVTTAALAEEEQAETLKIGNNGLPKHWLQGDPITEMKKDHLYIFEFWATWCGPCIAQMPHVEELYQATKDDDKVSIVGVNVFDDTPVEKLKAFIQKKGVTYPMGGDGSRSGDVAKMWLKPLGVTGIPHAIAVRNHDVIWKGHPSHLNLGLIKKLSDPGFSPEKQSAEDHKRKAAEDAAKEKHNTQVSKIYNSEPDEIAALADKFVADDHCSDSDIKYYRVAAFTKLFYHNRHVEAQQQLAKLAEETPNNSVNHIRLATIIITTDELEDKDLDLAIRSLERNIELNPDTACIAYQRITDAKLQQGDREGAIEAAKLAVQHSKHHQKLEAHLKSEDQSGN